MGFNSGFKVLGGGLLLGTVPLDGHSFHVIAEPDRSRDEGL